MIKCVNCKYHIKETYKSLVEERKQLPPRTVFYCCLYPQRMEVGKEHCCGQGVLLEEAHALSKI